MPEEESHDADSLLAGLKQAHLLDIPTEAAFRAVPRAAFLPDLPPDQVYKDEAVPIKVDEDGTVLSSSSQPSMMAIMLRQLRLAPGQNVLEVGTGTGYNAALMQHIVGSGGKVTSVEIDGQVVEQARANLQRATIADVLVVHADGAHGYAPRASYDRMIVTAGIWDVPEALGRQLKPNGILVAPIWLEGFEVSAALQPQRDGSFYSTDNRVCGFVRLRGQAAGPELGLRVGTSGLYLYVPTKIDSTALQMLLSYDAEDNYLGASLDIWAYMQGFLPYFIFHVPENFMLARYYVTKDSSAYGITDHGFALITPGSACFVSMRAGGSARSFGSADALLAVQDALDGWERAGKPQQDRLRLRLVSRDSPSFAVQQGKVYTRRDHYLIAWMDVGDTHG
jgi:protein-L-isoaspartate(D-aspartate) O-methyltransferase